MSDAKDLLEEWQEARYVAYVNFLRKKGLFDGWKAYKSGKGRQDEGDLMIAYIVRTMTVGNKAGAQE